MPEYIDMAPTDEGYGNMLMLFVQGILGDVPRRRRPDDAKLMDSVIDLVRYLSHAKPDEIQKVREYLQRVSDTNV